MWGVSVVEDGALSTLGRLALDAARVGAGVVRAALADGRFTVTQKTSPRDLVTEVDHAAENEIRGFLRRHRPHDAVLGEESGQQAGRTGVRWIVDPIDGTANFVRGRTDFAVAVAAEISGEARVGAIVRPASGEWAACDETGRVAGSGLVAVSRTERLDQALVSVSVSVSADRRDISFGLLQHLLPEIQDFRRTGSTSCDLLSVATGQLDAYIGVGTRPWDISPGWALVGAAGGRCLTLPAGHDVFVVGTPVVVDSLAPLVEQHLQNPEVTASQGSTVAAHRAAQAFPRGTDVNDELRDGLPSPAAEPGRGAAARPPRAPREPPGESR